MAVAVMLTAKAAAGRGASGGCPPLRALTFDVLGLIKVIEARDEDNGAPKVVEKWGEPDSSKCIEVLSPINGDVRVSIRVNDQTDTKPSDDVIVGLHMFKRPRLESFMPHCLCTTRGQVSITNTEVPQKHPNNSSDQTPTTWKLVLCNVLKKGVIKGNPVLIEGAKFETRNFCLHLRFKIPEFIFTPDLQEFLKNIFSSKICKARTFFVLTDLHLHQKQVYGSNNQLCTLAHFIRP
ncbi:hypothetical protein Leryth_005212 [Lithospermum erythrorhizon]|nr:hypothetical protein Leryth_005212 [Lithospermum erythrorhizon]